jgi:hypothetical protein
MTFRFAFPPLMIALFLLPCTSTKAVTENLLPILRLATSNYSESYSTSGTRGPPSNDPTRVLVGLHLGRSNKPFRIDNIGVSLTRMSAATEFCISISSGDARYQAVNAYRKAADSRTLPFVQTKSAYAKALAQRYSSEDFVTKIVETNRCGLDADGPIVPATPPGAAPGDVLIAFVNVTGSPAVMRLFESNKIIAETDCVAPLNDALVLYSNSCQLQLAGLGKIHPDRFEIKFFEKSAKTAEVSYKLEWPETAP